MTQKAQSVDPNLQQVVQHLANLCQQSYQSRVNNQAVPWFRPPLVPASTRAAGDWDGDLQTKQALIDLHSSFNTDQAEQQLEDVFDGTSNAGNGADTVVLSLMIDYAAQAERAFRARHQTVPRALAHYSSREEGHGNPNGALLGGSVNYFTSIITQGAEA
jgi:hypothetical protein